MQNKYYVLLSVGVIAGATFVMYRHAELRGQSAPVVHPATITYSRLFYGADSSTPRVTLTEILGVRADGSNSRARLVPAPDGSQLYNLKITDIPSGRHVIVDQISQSKTTYPAENIVSQYSVRPVNSCPGNASDAILSYPTLVSEQVLAEPGGSSRTIRIWRAPDLNCLPLREEQSMTDSSAGKVLVMLLTASRVVQGEPPSWMFDIPTGFVERSPSEMLSESARIRQVPPAVAPDGIARTYQDANSPKN